MAAEVAAPLPTQVAGSRLPLRIMAARVGGVEIPNQKRIEYSLQYVFGIGHTTAKSILSETVRCGPPVDITLKQGHARIGCAVWQCMLEGHALLRWPRLVCRALLVPAALHSPVLTAAAGGS